LSVEKESATAGQTVGYQQHLPPAAAALVWLLISFCGFIAVVALLVWPIRQLEQLVAWPHPASLAVWAFGWVIGGGLVALAAARLVFGAWLEARADAWLLLLGGATMSAAQVGVLSDWTIARFGYNDAELVGPMALLFGVIAGVAVAGFGVLVAPRRAAWAPFLAVAGGVALGLWIIASNAPGLSDGLALNSGTLALVAVAAATYMGGVGVISTARLRREF
jgi:hypothetical protein